MNAEIATPRSRHWKPRRWLWLIGVILIISAVVIGLYVQRAYVAAGDWAWQTARLELQLGRHSPPAVDSHRRAWFFTQAGQLVAYTLDGQMVETLPVPGGAQLGTDPTQVMLAAGPAGELWAASRSGKLAVHDEQGLWTTYDIFTSTSGHADNLVVDGRGVGWLITSQTMQSYGVNRQLVRLDPHTASHALEQVTPNNLNTAGTVGPDTVELLAADSVGHVWVLYDDGGLYETEDGSQWIRSGTPLSMNLVGFGPGYCLAFDPRGDPWVCGPIVIYRLGADGVWQGLAFRPHQGGMGSPIPPNSVATDVAGNIWVGTDGDGLEVRDPSGHWQVFTATNSGIDSTTVRVFPMDSQGTVWADTGSQLFRLGNQQVHPLPDGRTTGYELAAVIGFIGLLLLMSAIQFSLRGCATFMGVGLATLVLNFVATLVLARSVALLPLSDGTQLIVTVVLLAGANLLLLGRNLVGRRWAFVSGIVAGIVIFLGLAGLVLLVAAGGWGV